MRRYADEDDLFRLFNTRELDTIPWRVRSEYLFPEGSEGQPFDLVVRVSGPVRKIGVTYLPNGPVPAGIQTVQSGELRTFRNIYPKFGAELAIATDEDATVRAYVVHAPRGADDPEAAADDAVAELRRQYAFALARVGVEQAIPSTTTAGATELAKQGALIDLWASTLRDYARAGKKPTGSPFTWGDWYKQGAVLADGVYFLSGQSYDGSYFSVVVNSAKQNVQDVADAAVNISNQLRKAGENLGKPGGLENAAGMLALVGVGLAALYVVTR